MYELVSCQSPFWFGKTMPVPEGKPQENEGNYKLHERFIWQVFRLKGTVIFFMYFGASCPPFPFFVDSNFL